ncbi:polysaccharide deacetylase family protein [Actinoallomurus sp. CA-150999]|uniref:polysaccharide deacetylase family protein n=1 Tax=Actinoallomurus sp. CA-150999 TaxID=3239887 RepID=UPI003D8DE68B
MRRSRIGGSVGFVIPSRIARSGNGRVALRPRGIAIVVAVLGLGWLSGLGAHPTVASSAQEAARPAPAVPPAKPDLRSRPRVTGGSGAAVRPAGGLATRLRFLSWPPRAAASPAARPEVDCRKVKCIALTFDDGPGPYTAKLLDMLAARHVKVTFFLIGGNIRGREALVRRELAEGHAIGDHSWSHPQLSAMSDGAVRSELARTLGEIRRATGGGTPLMRPPYGATNRRVAAVTRHMGMAQILWSVDTNDWLDRNSAIVAHRAVSWAHPGDIILMHDIHPTTVNAVPKILVGLARRGFTFVTVPELFGGHALKPGQTYFDGPVPERKSPQKQAASHPKGQGGTPAPPGAGGPTLPPGSPATPAPGAPSGTGTPGSVRSGE